MRIVKIAIAIAACVAANAATAQVVGLGTTQVGATNQLSVGIAKVVSDKGGLQMRTQPMAGAVQYAPLVNRGEIEFGISNMVETYYLYHGRVLLEGKEMKDLRLAARLVPWVNGFLVKKDSPIKTIRDLKGQPVPYGFTGNPLGRVLLDGYLANAGMTAADVKQVLVPAFPRMFDAFKQQQVVATIATIGQAQVKEWDAALGGVRWLSFDPAPAAVAALNKHIPHSWVVEVKPQAGLTGVDGVTQMLNYDYTLWVHHKVADDVVTKTVEALYNNPEDLRASSPLWKEFDPKAMARDLGIAYHPGAIKFYQSKGIWSR